MAVARQERQERVVQIDNVSREASNTAGVRL
jgi:hypothetical protein